MSTARASSSSDRDHQTSEPSTKTTLSPSWPFKQIFDNYYGNAGYDRDALKALIQPRHTTKASILFHAVGEGAITYTDYLNHTFPIQVRFSYPKPQTRNLQTGDLLIIMCIDEGSTEGFKKELERIFSDDYLKFKSVEFKSMSIHVGFPHADSKHGFITIDHFGENTHVTLRYLKVRGSVDKITAECDLRYLEGS